MDHHVLGREGELRCRRGDARGLGPPPVQRPRWRQGEGNRGHEVRPNGTDLTAHRRDRGDQRLTWYVPGRRRGQRRAGARRHLLPPALARRLQRGRLAGRREHPAALPLTSATTQRGPGFVAHRGRFLPSKNYPKSGILSSPTADQLSSADAPDRPQSERMSACGGMKHEPHSVVGVVWTGLDSLAAPTLTAKRSLPSRTRTRWTRSARLSIAATPTSWRSTTTS